MVSPSLISWLEPLQFSSALRLHIPDKPCVRRDPGSFPHSARRVERDALAENPNSRGRVRSKNVVGATGPLQKREAK